MTLTATNEIHSKVRGTTFRKFDWSLLEEGDQLQLEREPSNPHDPNAIKCVHPQAGHIGYIGADLAESLAPTMDGGAIVDCVITDITGGTENAKNRGINIRLTVNQAVG